MNRKNRQNDTDPHAPDEQPDPQSAEQPGEKAEDQLDEAGDAQTSPADQVERELHETIAMIEKERDDLEDRLKRIAADYQNFVRRSEQNASAARDQQLVDVVRGLVTVLDHFDRAVQVDPEKTSTKDLLAGVMMVRDEFLRALKQLGVERLDVEKGEPFDPNRHEALMRQTDEDVETNHVTAQFQPGYLLKDKTIRPAQVSVAE